jgi:hypothetical protein
MNAFRDRLGILLILFVTLACGLPSVMVQPTLAPRPATSTTTTSPTATSAPTLAPTFTPTPEATPTSEVILDPQLSREGIDLFPWPLYAGDQLSVDVDPLFPDGAGVASVGQGATVTLQLDAGEVFTSPVGPMGLDDAPQARFYWVAEVPLTSQTAVMTVTLSLPSEITDTNLANNSLVISVPLLPRAQLPPPEPEARWVMTETKGFRLHYLTGSAADRDLLPILSVAGTAYNDVAARLGDSTQHVDIYLLDRVIGQGGYASSDWVAVSYPDRRYSPVGIETLFRHELVHRLDDTIECDGAPSMMREGLAVYLAGGHYRRESLRGKAAVLLATPHLIPLQELVVDFYTHQHEVAYLQAGALVQYLAERYGWEAMSTMCGAASESGGDEMVQWLAALEAVGIADARQLEATWHTWLSDGDGQVDQSLLELELRLMDLMRAYQATYDPAAHFIEGLLFSPAEAERMDLVANFVRRPREPEALAIELALGLAQEALEQPDPTLLRTLVDQLSVALTEDVVNASLVQDLRELSVLALAQDYEPYRVVLEESGRYRLYVLDRQRWPQQTMLTATWEGVDWQLSGGTAIE